MTLLSPLCIRNVNRPSWEPRGCHAGFAGRACELAMGAVAAFVHELGRPQPSRPQPSRPRVVVVCMQYGAEHAAT